MSQHGNSIFTGNMKSKRRRLQRARLYKTTMKSLVKMTSDTATLDSSDTDVDASGSTEGAVMPQTVHLKNAEADTDSHNHLSVTAGQNDSDSGIDIDIWEVINDANEIELSSESEDEDQCSRGDHLKNDLISWTNKHQIKHNALDDLLKLLKEHVLEDLPVTARTLLKTDKNVETSVKSDMQYIHFNVRDKLLKCLQRYPREVLTRLNAVEISLNVDGLPIFKSTKSSVWPVLCALHLPDQPVSVFPITLTYGTSKSKPTDLDFLSDAVKDIGEILDQGLEYNGTIIQVKLRCVVCDAPAKALVKDIKLCSGYYGCDRCTQKGEWFQKSYISRTRSYTSNRRIIPSTVTRGTS